MKKINLVLITLAVLAAVGALFLWLTSKPRISFNVHCSSEETSALANVAVVVNGQLIGTTDNSGNVQVFIKDTGQSLELKLELQGYRTIEKNERFGDGKNYTFEMQSAAKLLIKAIAKTVKGQEPVSGVQIFINNRLQENKTNPDGTLQVEASPINGQFIIEARKPVGFYPEAKTVTFVSGQSDYTVEIELKPSAPFTPPPAIKAELPPTFTPTDTATAPAALTATNTPTKTAVLTATLTLVPTATPTISPTRTKVLTATKTAAATATLVPTRTVNATMTLQPTRTHVPTATLSPTRTPKTVPTAVPTKTRTITIAPTITLTPTLTPTVTPKPATITPTPTTPPKKPQIQATEPPPVVIKPTPIPKIVEAPVKEVAKQPEINKQPEVSEQPVIPTVAAPPPQAGDAFTITVTAPEGTKITINDKDYGLVPVTASLPRGTYKVIATPPQEMYRPEEKVVILSRNDAIQFKDFQRDLFAAGQKRYDKYLAKNDHTELTMAENYFQQIIAEFQQKKIPSHQDRREFLQSAYTIGRIYLEENNFTKAEEMFKLMLAEDKTQPQAFWGLGMIYYRQKMWEKAIEQFNEAKKFYAQYSSKKGDKSELLMELALYETLANYEQYKQLKEESDNEKSAKLQFLNKINNAGHNYLSICEDVGKKENNPNYRLILDIIKEMENSRRRLALSGAAGEE